MKVIEYRVQYTGNLIEETTPAGASYEVVRVQARDINSGFTKALKTAREPLGSGKHREIGAVEFWQIV